jgi:integrase-like protein
MRRRQRGTVGFRNGRWFIYYRTPAGKQVYQRGFPSEAAAIARLNDIMAEIYRGEYIDHKEITFAEFAKGYLSRRLSIRGSTSSSYASMIRHHLIPYFGSMKLAEIRLDMIQSFVHEFGENRSVKTLHNIVTLLKVMLVGSKGSSAIKLFIMTPHVAWNSRHYSHAALFHPLRSSYGNSSMWRRFWDRMPMRWCTWEHSLD